MTDLEKIGKFETIFLVITVIFNNLILNVPSIIISKTGTGSWINIIYITLLTLFFILFICEFYKPFSKSDIIDIAEFLGGKFLKNIMSILYIVLFIMTASISLRLFANSLRLIYFDSTPLIILFLFFLIPVAIVSKLGLRAVSGVNTIIIIVSIITFFVYFFAASGFFVFQRLFPIMGYGTRVTFINSITNIFSFNIVGYLYFLKPFLKHEQDFNKLSILSIIIYGIFLLLSILALIMSFSFITHINETLSVFIVTRLISFGNFFQRVDALITFVWILIILSFLSFNVFITSYIIKKNTKLKLDFNIPIVIIVFFCALSFKNIATAKGFTEGFAKFYYVFLIFVLSFIVLLLAFIKRRHNEKK